MTPFEAIDDPQAARMTRTLLFHRDFERYSGGHGKVWDYFRHTAAAPGWEPRVYLAERSTSEQNPWRTHSASQVAEWDPQASDALFLGGMDWEAYPADDPRRPVINLVQHVRHGDPKDPRHRFLSRAAVRICVSHEVAEAVRPRDPNGPVLVIEAGIELPEPKAGAPRSGIFIDAIKQPALGRALAARLREDGRTVHLNDSRIARHDYLARLASAEVAVVLPRATEGFYLPGLEAMALGCVTVVPDCVGNRGYLQPGRNALVPELQLEALARAVDQLDDGDLRSALTREGIATAQRFSLVRERASYHRVLADLPALWQETRPA